MATTLQTKVQYATDGDVITWAAIPNGNQGDACGGPYRTASFQVTGTFGAGGNIRLEGSNDGTTWVALSPTALVAAGLFAALGGNEHTRFIRPSVTAGDGTTAITVTGFLANTR